ncbi:MAG: hypothetical protein SOZ62_02570 [Eubacteriales bacterium]|nr:hypothetical protein [Eubacteriales bacterium]
MADTTGLAKYIQRLLKDSGTSKNAMSPEEYSLVHGSGAQYDTALEETIKNIKTRLPTYGSNAEKLAESGLQNSGYGDYIKDNTADELLRAQENAQNYGSESTAALRGYAKYLENVQKNVASMRKDLLYRLTSPKAGDYTSGYKLALEYGMSDEDAKKLSKAASEFRESGIKGKYDVMNYIIEHRFKYNEAYAYALASGLEDRNARLVAEAADKINSDYEEQVRLLFDSVKE